MKTVILAFLLCLSCQAENSEWSKKDAAMECAYMVVHCADWIQTLNITDASNLRVHESNSILGNKCSRAKVNYYFALAGLGHYAISRMLHGKWRTIWQSITIGIEASYVSRNYSLGVKIKL